MVKKRFDKKNALKFRVVERDIVHDPNAAEDDETKWVLVPEATYSKRKTERLEAFENDELNEGLFNAEMEENEEYDDNERITEEMEEMFAEHPEILSRAKVVPVNVESRLLDDNPELLDDDIKDLLGITDIKTVFDAPENPKDRVLDEDNENEDAEIENEYEMFEEPFEMGDEGFDDDILAIAQAESTEVKFDYNSSEEDEEFSLAEIQAALLENGYNAKDFDGMDDKIRQATLHNPEEISRIKLEYDMNNLLSEFGDFVGDASDDDNDEAQLDEDDLLGHAFLQDVIANKEHYMKKQRAKAENDEVDVNREMLKERIVRLRQNEEEDDIIFDANAISYNEVRNKYQTEDVESVASTLTNIYNHPKTILEPKIKISSKGFPLGVLNDKNKKIEEKTVPKDDFTEEELELLYRGKQSLKSVVGEERKRFKELVKKEKKIQREKKKFFKNIHNDYKMQSNKAKAAKSKNIQGALIR
eukprot:TRINITY_DN3091_c0_g2_i1.p2 TRINITY_DN3091_c0_g2~~TRINITY_DN3091_c0_g2_i1.p2  ORF type:complete len:474 (+),score=185.00 TRINITY_DN3091_c0_g2_i1:2986-4407(+)